MWKALDGVFPPSCAGCGISGTRWCQECSACIRPVSGQFCISCGQGIKSHSSEICDSCREYPPAFDALRFIGQYDDRLRKAILGLKFSRNLGMAEVFAQWLWDRFQTLGWSVDGVAAAPLSAERLKQRGFNQAEWIARPFSWLADLPYLGHGLVKVRNTDSQVGLSVERRRMNISGAFKADSRLVSGRKLLIIDDVATTASTLNSCAQALRSAGAAGVYALTLARARLHQDLQILSIPEVGLLQPQIKNIQEANDGCKI